MKGSYIDPGEHLIWQMYCAMFYTMYYLGSFRSSTCHTVSVSAQKVHSPMDSDGEDAST